LKGQLPRRIPSRREEESNYSVASYESDAGEEAAGELTSDSEAGDYSKEKV
jgi:hypothetical protein